MTPTERKNVLNASNRKIVANENTQKNLQNVADRDFVREFIINFSINRSISQIELMKLRINGGEKLLTSLCESHHYELFAFLISHGLKNWNWGLSKACETDSDMLVKLMISKGANQCNCRKSISEHY